jgi:hypothetical protein
LRILQIMPAVPGTFAVFKGMRPGERETYRIPVICWAVIEAAWSDDSSNGRDATDPDRTSTYVIAMVESPGDTCLATVDDPSYRDERFRYYDIPGEDRSDS